MRKLSILVLVLSLSFASCNSNPDRHRTNKVYQKVIVSDSNRYLQTSVIYNGQTLSCNFDKIDNITTDSILTITTSRFNDGVILLNGINKLNNVSHE